MTEKINDIENDENSKKGIHDYLERLETDLKQHGVKKYDYSQFNALEIVGSGGFATVYSAIFQGKKYALKSVPTKIDNNYLIIDKIVEKYKINIHNYNEFTNCVKIGEGGYGWVEKAVWKARGSMYALKSLKIKNNSSEILIRKFAKELSDAKSSNKQLDLQNLSKPDTCEYNMESYDYSKFSNLQPIKQGTKARVFSAVFQGKMYALKCTNRNSHLDDRTLKMFKISDHPNIIKFYGVSKDPQTNNIITVLQLASNGNLQDYLKGKQQNGVFKISWDNIKRIAKEIAFGLNHLHVNEIAHRNLDVVGTYIAKGLRESIISNTPQNYADLYMKCWSSDPDQRPPLYKILNILIEISKMADGSKYITNYIFESEHFKNYNKKTTYTDIKNFCNGLHLTSDTIYSPDYINESDTNNKLLNNLLRTPKNVFINLNKNHNLNSDFQCLLGFFNLTGIGTETYFNAAFKLFEKIAYENNAIGKFYLGECFMFGYGTKKDLNKAIEWYQKACRGCARSNNVLGNWYEHGIIVEKCEEKAFEHYRKSADYNNPLGQFNLARCYEEGIGVIKNLRLAKHWYEKAANDGHKDAINQLNNLVP
ncbi:27242_t:CDS:10, partial [Dentiscutata erythropus]